MLMPSRHNKESLKHPSALRRETLKSPLKAPKIPFEMSNALGSAWNISSWTSFPLMERVLDSFLSIEGGRQRARCAPSIPTLFILTQSLVRGKMKFEKQKSTLLL